MVPPGSTSRCLYEVLGVSRDCSLEEIRSAYKKLALRLHPDKVAQSAGGATDDAEATATFQELQHAYDVLRDPKERAWYDAHRSQILFASSRRPTQGANTGSTDDGAFANFFSSFFSKFTASDGRGPGRASKSPMDDIGNIFSFFTPSAYSGFSDTGSGFYKVYGDLFSKIYSNEVRFAKEVNHGVDPDEVLEPAPLIGNLDSSYEQWTAFYKYWLGFSTLIDFSWADLYDVREGFNRRVRREMEELNNKARKKMRREYNDTVRSLAAFVKKRDKRVVEMLRKKKAEEEERKEEQRKKKEEEKKKKEEARLYREAEWAENDEEDDGALYDAWYGSEADGKKKKSNGEQELYCVVCSKKFKSDKQWKNHEQSKKHKDKVAELRESFQDEDELLGVNDDADDDAQVGDGIDVGFDYVQESSDDSGDGALNELSEKFEDGFVFQEQAVEHEISDPGVVGLGSEDETVILEAMISNHRSRKAVSLEQSNMSPGERGEVPNNDAEGESPMEHNLRRKGRRTKASKKGNRSKPYGDDAETMDTNGSLDVDDGKRCQDVDEQVKESASDSLDQVGSSKRGGRNSGKTLKPQQQRQQRDEKSGVNKEADSAAKISSKGKKQKGTSKAPSNMCGTCGESFDSRNKLFMHLGDTGHAMLKTR
ncbi:unnamed protein product [Spirodela intermedia]|uniref:Uncharacterized protein n=1 Tax=Spirodela intermedia TaxID=51605 RepID=A0A7I8K7G2_SPIIN|nr:unnamed protein product [Spirodela intermedia]